MKYIGWTFLGLLIFGGLGFGIFALRLAALPAAVANRTLDVAQQQFDPAVLLQRYEWFKDAAASLDQKEASVKVYARRLTEMKAQYGDAPRSKWAREDREQFSIWTSEVDGIKASYNELAAQYNAQMAKFNWRFTNRGMLPQGATEPLPREFKPYVED